MTETIQQSPQKGHGKKRLVRILAGVLVVIAALLIGSVTVLGPVVRQAILAIAPAMTGCQTELEKVGINPFTGAVTLKGLVLRNPEGFQSQQALALGSVSVNLKMTSLLSGTLVIEDILVDKPAITYEMKTLATSNLDAIMENVRGKNTQASSPDEADTPPTVTTQDTETASSSLPDRTDASSETAPAEEQPKRKVIIDHIKITEGRIGMSAPFLQGNEVVLALPPIELNDLGKKDGGITASQAVSITLETILQSVFENSRNIGNGATNLLQGILKF